MTTYSNTIASLWAGILSLHPKLRPRTPLTKKLFLEYVLPIGLSIALEIGCSNFALELLSVSFGTILKGGSPVFTFGWGLFFRLERFSWSVFCALLTIAVGIALATLGEGQEFQLLGFSLQLFSTSLGELRWAMTHKLLKGSGDATGEEKMSPLTATLYTGPTTALCVLPVALGLEAKAVWNDSSLSHGTDSLLIVGVMTGIATLIFALIVSEYWLVNATSSLALSVAGVFKELLTIGGGLFFFAEHVDFLNVIGFFTCQMGILSYVYLRYDKQQPSYAHVSEHGEEILLDQFSDQERYTDEGMELPPYNMETLSHRHKPATDHVDGGILVEPLA